VVFQDILMKYWTFWSNRDKEMKQLFCFISLSRLRKKYVVTKYIIITLEKKLREERNLWKGYNLGLLPSLIILAERP